MRLRFRLALWSALVFAFAISSATADPIIVVYHVQVTERMTWASNPIWEPFPQEFTLQMTFDPANASFDSYGPVWFSPIPLPGVSPPPDLTLTTNRYTAHGTFEENPYGSWNLFASATVYEYGWNAEWSYFRNTRLISNVPPGGWSPVFTPETFPGHLVLGPYNFDYGTSLFGSPPGSRTPETLSYRGFATLVDVHTAEPIPEPGTLALLGGGLAILARTRRRDTARLER
jgi:hypothetical protein